MFEKILIANRGEIALRVARTCREMGIGSVAVYSTADRDGAVAGYADEAVHIGPPAAQRSYLNIPNIIEAALRCGADAIHPGYGFLSEDPDFARICADNGITFIGPAPEVMEQVADKAIVRRLMAEAGLPVLPGSDGRVPSLAEAEEIAAAIGYPVVVKAAAGGGGRGIGVAADPAALRATFAEITALGSALFGDGSVYLERLVTDARHVEVQVLCGPDGAVHLGERDCSLQRRKQKLIEESPAPNLPPGLRERLGEFALRGVRSLGYTGAGTVEFLVDAGGEPTFMEINARIQVEHPVTEMVTGVDLIRAQIRVAAGEPLGLTQSDIRPTGAAIECRVNAEDPDNGFRPAPGALESFRPPSGPWTRVDSGFEEGDLVPSFYDSLLAKVIVWAPSREEAIARCERALGEFAVSGPGVATTLPFTRRLLADPAFLAGEHTTTLIENL
ncbi:acetyl/propionyl/methylcrotonyl-CoA carboxylase subunit alpha [Amycolatopsis thailandensis]|uniref:acetyl/propionyl/methylcrotonyl-CoA carboxylase subunit alpha n=1 Tax=Amycolatopsis thailandensis TaxID=589330 RepID=UPI0037BA5CD0